MLKALLLILALDLFIKPSFALGQSSTRQERMLNPAANAAVYSIGDPSDPYTGFVVGSFSNGDIAMVTTIKVNEKVGDSFVGRNEDNSSLSCVNALDPSTESLTIVRLAVFRCRRTFESLPTNLSHIGRLPLSQTSDALKDKVPACTWGHALDRGIVSTCGSVAIPQETNSPSLAVFAHDSEFRKMRGAPLLSGDGRVIGVLFGEWKASPSNHKLIVPISQALPVLSALGIEFSTDPIFSEEAQQRQTSDELKKLDMRVRLERAKNKYLEYRIKEFERKSEEKENTGQSSATSPVEQENDKIEIPRPLAPRARAGITIEGNTSFDMLSNDSIITVGGAFSVWVGFNLLHHSTSSALVSFGGLIGYRAIPREVLTILVKRKYNQIEPDPDYGGVEEIPCNSGYGGEAGGFIQLSILRFEATMGTSNSECRFVGLGLDKTSVDYEHYRFLFMPQSADNLAIGLSFALNPEDQFSNAIPLLSVSLNLGAEFLNR
jgi:hypothetical protein